MNIKCDVIRDLLPLYMDGLVSEETKKLVEEHLEQCEDCRGYLAELEESEKEMPRREFAEEMKPLKKIKRKAMFNKIALVVVALALLAFGLFVIKSETSSRSWDVDDNASWTVPEGYVLDPEYEDEFYKVYVRETDKTRETISIECESPNNVKYMKDEENKVDIGGGWESWIYKQDFDNTSSNELIGVICRDGNDLRIDYNCKILDKEGYYESCSPEQQEELLTFLRTFEYKETAVRDGNFFKRFLEDWGIMGLVVFLPTLLIIIGIPLGAIIGSFMGGREMDDRKNEPINSMELHEEMNEERKKHGEDSIPAINTVGGVSSNSIARKDKSWSSVPDFFAKLIRRK